MLRDITEIVNGTFSPVRWRHQPESIARLGNRATRSFRIRATPARDCPMAKFSIRQFPEELHAEKRPLDPQDGPGTRHDKPLLREASAGGRGVLRPVFLRL